MDTPIFLDVAQIVSGYTLETEATVMGQFSPESLRGDSFAGGSVSGKLTDRPTISYTPLTGKKFLRGLLDPVPPQSIFCLLQAGYDATFMLGLSLDSFNGLSNAAFRSGRTRPADPEFVRVITLWQSVQDAGAVGMGVGDMTGSQPSPVMLFFRPERRPPEIIAQVLEIEKLLKLPKDTHSFRLVYSPVRGRGQELAVGSRSIIQMLNALAMLVEVPEADIRDKRTVPAADMSAWADAPLRIRCATEQPKDDAFVAIQYRHHWFWIDDQDWKSKRTFSAIMFLFTLNESSTVEERLPMLTIPTS